MDVSANGGRVRFTRDVANIVMDLNDVETVNVKALGGADTLTVNDLSGTDLTSVVPDLGGNDGSADNVIVNATNGDDVVTVSGTVVGGLAARVNPTGIGTGDRLTVNTLAGDDVVDASAANAALLLTLSGGDGDDVLVGGPGGDTLLGGNGDDVLLGGPGADIFDGGPGSNIVIDSNAGIRKVAAAKVGGKAWLTKHMTTVKGKTVIKFGDASRTLPRAKLKQLVA